MQQILFLDYRLIHIVVDETWALLVHWSWPVTVVNTRFTINVRTDSEMWCSTLMYHVSINARYQ